MAKLCDFLSLILHFGSKISLLSNYILWIDYFIIGAIIGWLYGKFKNRKSPLTKGADAF